VKQRLLAHFPDMCAQSKGRDVMLIFDKDIGACDRPARTSRINNSSLSYQGQNEGPNNSTVLYL